MGNRHTTRYHCNPWLPVYKNEFNRYKLLEDLRIAKVNDDITKINSIQKDLEMVQQMYADMKTAIRNFSRTDLKENIQRYLNHPINDFIKSFDPSYISNNNTIYLKITSLDRATNTTSTLDDQNVSYTKPTQSIYDIMDEDTTYEDIAYIDEFDPNDYFYEPEGGNLVRSEDADDYSKVILFNKNNIIIRTLKSFSTFDMKKDFSFSFEELIESMEIAPGVKVTVANGRGITASYTNSADATDYKKIILDSSMRANTTCIETAKNEADFFNCVVTTITVSPL